MSTTTTKASSLTDLQTNTRILLTLWELGGEVKRGDLTKRLVRGKEKSGDYKPFLQQLEEKGAIATTKAKVSLLPSGVELLSVNLSDPNFEFTSQVGAKTANALLKWMREMGGTLSEAETNGKVVAEPITSKVDVIASYDAFKTVALEVYDRLNRDYNYDNLVPIYRIRREIGNQVSRSDFDQWFLELQTKDVLQLIGGEMPEITPDKAEDSIKTALGGARYYAKRL